MAERLQMVSEENEMSEKPKCSKCGGEMAEGFILDADFIYSFPMPRAAGMFTQARWVEGKPVPSRNSGIKWNDKEAYRIAAYRCPNCGLLELHAMDPSKYPEFP
jgi:ssDNA-binding Zn-finger/Zn-ribbon topoisomerase 1